MKVLGRGSSEVVDVPDQPAAPTLTGGTPAARGSEAAAQTQATSDHSTASAGSTGGPALITVDTSSPAPTTVSFAHTDTPAQLTTVASAVVDIQVPAAMHGDLGGSGETGGSGEIGRGSDTLASLSLDGPAYADHGWFIVPSATAEYGQAYAAADDFAFDVAAGEFSADWFWV